MNTIRLENKQHTKIIAHRGMSGLETENTTAAFVAAGNRTHIGIETDVHVTADGKYILIHDDTTARVAGDDLSVEGSTFDELTALTLFQKDGEKGRVDLKLPPLADYIRICKAYDKIAVLELKNRFTEEHIRGVVETIRELGWLEKTVFISFWYENLTDLRGMYPDQPIQFLTGSGRDDFDWLIGELAKNRFGLDVQHAAVTKELVDKCHAVGVEVNCWTVDDPARAEELIAMGVDYITSNILE